MPAFLFKSSALLVPILGPVMAGWLGTKCATRQKGLFLVIGAFVLMAAGATIFAWIGIQNENWVVTGTYIYFAKTVAVAALLGSLIGAAIVYW
jgi:hypothetical protein